MSNHTYSYHPQISIYKSSCQPECWDINKPPNHSDSMEYRIITISGYNSLGSRGFTFDQPNQMAQDPYLQGDKSSDSTICWEKLKYLVCYRKTMANLDSVLKSRDIILPTKVCIAKAMVFPVVIHGFGSWTMKKAKSRRIDTSEFWCWRWLKSPLDSKEIIPIHWKDWCWSWRSNTLST